MSPIPARTLRDDPTWNLAVDWCMRVHSNPDDRDLLVARDAWLAEDEARRAAYRRAEKVWLLAGEAAVSTAVPPRRRPAAPLAAAMALAACVALVLLPQIRTSILADFSTGLGQVERVMLADGSSIHLGAGSAANVDLAGERRAVSLLKGVAYFDVVADPNRPFTVSANGIVVKVVGTAFEVQVAGEEISVAVRSGIVTVAAGADEVRLVAGERLAVDRFGGKQTKTMIAPQLVASWMEGRLVVDGATISEVVDQFRRYHPGIIVIGDDDLRTRRVTGVFDLGDPVAALNAVVQPHGGAVSDWPFLVVLDRE